MRVAVLSDIHGNLPALEAVLLDIERQRVDRIVDLGDLCSGPLWPRETADRLISLGWPTIRGNHERQLIETAIDRMEASDRYAAATMRQDQLDWMAALPATLKLDELLLVHGSPRSDVECLLETVTAAGMRTATAGEVGERLGDAAAPLTLCGHTHLQRTWTLGDGRMIVNPGSVGLPAYRDDRPFPHSADSGSPHARYALLTRGSGWRVEFRRVEYDWESAALQAEANNRADWARALRTGLA